MKHGTLDSAPQEARPSLALAAILIGPLSLLGELLIARTHHRPLGAATFATVALLLWVGAELVSRRLLDDQVPARRVQVRKWMWGFGLLSLSLVAFRVLLAA